MSRGIAHSVEAGDGARLVGGLYGLSLGAAFFGESMFALAPDASKLAFVALCRQLVEWGLTLVDCQVYTPHLARFGAEEWPRRRYLAALKKAGVNLDRKVLAELAVTDPSAFAKLTETAKAQSR